ncbi:conserved hypothetical protein [Ferrimonas balearica DSM 9799]|uniref:DUF2835 domain-containing protein n=1 Tax=Ferrimonas balearica (strain DSM 9799 / CCM 4581 / KCTC 23876 / PAT) TaxID=550540 RepID=E1ST34_FERBD|nr:DUF2835 family protein [Ferrimonas balearica]ADN76081.1 conserved hypothetical protein [Ferrimonas balearica DSM 9799]
MQRYQFDLRIPAQAMLRYYQGRAQLVVIRDRQGKVLHLHPRYLRPHLRPEGVVGSFELRLSQQGEFVELVRI